MRSDAEQNREKVIAAARELFADPGADVSMAQVARRAGIGSATLYRNFPNRKALLEALYADEIDTVCAAAQQGDLEDWLRSFYVYFSSKRFVAEELLEHTDAGDPFFSSGRARVMAAGEPLLAAAQAAGEARTDLTLDQVLAMVSAVAKIGGDEAFRAPILQAALDAVSGGRPRSRPGRA